MYYVPPKSSQSGNVLFLILIAVALFAALTLAITASSRSGSNSTDNEKAQMAASEFAQYAASLSTAIMRMRASGCTDLMLSFEHPSLAHPAYWGGSGNPAAPADKSCHVFGPQGVVMINNLTGSTERLNITEAVGVDMVGTEASEILLFVNLGEDSYSKKVCDAFNKAVGNTGSAIGGTIRTLGWGWAKGVFQATPSATDTIGEDSGVALRGGKQSGCIDGGTSHDGATRYLYQVLLPR